MLLTMIGLLTISAGPGDGTNSHRATLDHRGAPLTVDYRATLALDMRQAGMAAPTRMGVIRCDWVAKVAIHRSMERSELSRVIAEGFELRGNRPGTCASAQKAISNEIARRQDEVRAHLLAVADRDRAQLLAELEAVHSVARGAS